MRFLPASVRLVLLFVLALLTSFVSAPAWSDQEILAAAPVNTSSVAGLSVIHKVMDLVKSDFMTPTPPSTLIGGAFTGMHKYLADHKLSTAPADVSTDPRTLTVALLDAHFKQIIATREVRSLPLTEAAIRGMLSTLSDPYTVYMDKQEYSGLMEQMSGGNFGGLGIYIEPDKKHDNRLTIVEPMDDSPASKAGIQSGDVILKIDGTSTTGMSVEDASKRLRGQEGTAVTLTILRGEQTIDVTMNRAHIQMKTANYKLLDNGIGYVRLRIFGENTAAELEDAFRAFDKAQVKGYILDLRNNGGGYINTAVDVCSEFLPTGSRVVSVVERGTPENVYSSLPNVRPNHPLVVLVNKYSASASEITAGAIQDLHAGTLMGTHTFGKGSVQKIFPLPDGTAVKITTAHYHTPSGRDIHKVGIDPEIVNDMDPQDVGTPHDTQLVAATNWMATAISKQPVAMLNPAAVTSSDSIPVADPSDEYDIVSRHPCEKDGSPMTIVSHETVQKDGHYYDRVVGRCPQDGHEQVFMFDLSTVLGH